MKNNFKILAIMPARGGSKGVPRKNIKMLGGKPLLAYSVEAVLGSGCIDKLIVATDDSEIKREALKLGAEVVDEPKELACDECKTEPVMLYVVDYLEKRGYHSDFVALVQATSPFLNSEIIKLAVGKVIEGSFDSCFTAYIPEGYEFKWRKGKEGYFVRIDYPLENSPRRQDLPKIYHENGAFYITRSELFKKSKNRLGGSLAKITCVEMSQMDSLQIDSRFDFWLAEQILKLKRSGKQNGD